MMQVRKKEFTVESFKNYCYVTLIKCIGDDVESRKKEGKCVVMEGGSDSYLRNYIIACLTTNMWISRLYLWRKLRQGTRK